LEFYEQAWDIKDEIKQLEKMHKRVQARLEQLRQAFLKSGYSIRPPEPTRHPQRNVNIGNTVSALRAKAADPGVTKHEAAAFAAKADELEKKMKQRQAV
jgi:Protein of unknown function (DUF2786)